MNFLRTTNGCLLLLLVLLGGGACAGGGGVSVGTGFDGETVVDLEHEEDYAPRAADLQPASVAFWYRNDTTTTTQKPGVTGPTDKPEETFQLTLALAQLDFLEMHFRTAALFECDDSEQSEYLEPVCTSGWVSFLGNWRADLLDASFAPAITGVLLPATTYTELRLGLDDGIKPNLVVEGIAEKWLDGVPEETVSFRIKVVLQADIRIRDVSGAGVTIDDQALHVIGLEVLHSRWFAGVAGNLFDCADSKQARFDADGTLLVTPGQQGECNKIAGNIRSNFVSAAALAGE